MLCRIRNALDLLGLGQAGQHSDLDGPDRYGRLLQAAPAAGREPRGKDLPDGCLRGPGHVTLSFQGLEQHIQADRTIKLGEHADARDALAELNDIGLAPELGPDIDQTTALDELTARYEEMMRRSQAELNRYIRL